MRWSRGGGRTGPRGYHHGNLKEALVRAALELLAEPGPAGFTFADAAPTAWTFDTAGFSFAGPKVALKEGIKATIKMKLTGLPVFPA